MTVGGGASSKQKGGPRVADKMVLKNMVFYGYHGAFDAERELGQKYEVDVELHTNLSLPGDDPDLALSYVDAFTVVKEMVEERDFNLIEAMAEAIAQQILTMFELDQVLVRVRKYQVPIGGVMDYLEVELARP